MSTHKSMDKICCLVLAATLVLTLLFMNAEALGVQKVSASMGYETRLFDTSKVHTIDIVMEDWDSFLASCQDEEYRSCTVVIDQDAYKNVAIRAKGNTSLTQVAAYGNNRYSFKIEFDHYDSSKKYYGLDKLCLNNIIQDNTYMKDFVCYQMMREMGVASPLCSYVYITVNGEDWGLYLAVEGVEEAFLQRNFGKNYGALYKPDSMSMGSGRGNGNGFDMEDFMENFQDENGFMERPDANRNFLEQGESKPEFSEKPDVDSLPSMPDRETPTPQTNPEAAAFSDKAEWKERNPFSENEDFKSAANGMMGSSEDVLLKYTDENPESYANIFDHAKTDVTDADQKRLIASLQKLSAQEDLAQTVDTEAVIRYFVVHNFVLNFDSYTGSMIHNYYLYERDGQLQMIPWDYNLAFGGFETASSASELVNMPIDTPVSGGNVEDRPMLAWIFGNETYLQQYHQVFSQWIAACFESGDFESWMDVTTEMIAPYVEKDPTKFCTYEEFETGVETLKEFCMLRAKSIRGQLDGTIGATKETQQSETWIDAGDLQIQDMGAMNFSMGGNFSRLDFEMENEAEMPMAEGTMPERNPEDTEQKEFAQPGEDSFPMDFSPDRMQQSTQPEKGKEPVSVTQNSTKEAVVLLGVSLAVLIVGLLTAKCYRRRR